MPTGVGHLAALKPVCGGGAALRALGESTPEVVGCSVSWPWDRPRRGVPGLRTQACVFALGMKGLGEWTWRRGPA